MVALETQRAALQRPRVVARFARSVVVFLLIGLAMTLAVSWLLAMFAGFDGAFVVSATGVSGDETWSITVCQKPGSIYVLSQRELGADWSPHRATGAPDAGSTESSLAWCPATMDGGQEWLLLEYAGA